MLNVAGKIFCKFLDEYTGTFFSLLWTWRGFEALEFLLSLYRTAAICRTELLAEWLRWREGEWVM
jgi:hypothetical protein